MLEFDLRHYDPVLGRFVTTDPYKQFSSPYIAMGNNPVVAFDPDGGKCFDANGNEVACPDDEMYDEYRDSDKQNITLLDEVEVLSSESNQEDSGETEEETFNVNGPIGLQVLPAKRTLLGKVVSTLEPRTVTLNGFTYRVDASGEITGLQPLGGLGAIGLIGGAYNPKDLLRIAKALDRGGLTKIGRALQKHGSRPGSRFPQAVGNPASINAQGEKVLSNILNNPGSKATVRHTGRFGDVLEVVAPNGQGARFSKDGKEFLGLINR